MLVRPAELDETTQTAWLDHLDHRIRAWTGNVAQIIDLTPATLGQMTRANDPLVDSWRADDIHLHGERLLDILDLLRRVP